MAQNPRTTPAATSATALGGLDLSALARLAAGETATRVAGQAGMVSDAIRFGRQLEDAGYAADAQRDERAAQLDRERRASSQDAERRQSAAVAAAREAERKLKEEIATQEFGFRFGQALEQQRALAAAALEEQAEEPKLSDMPSYTVDPTIGALYNEDPDALLGILGTNLTEAGRARAEGQQLIRDLPDWAKGEAREKVGGTLADIASRSTGTAPTEADLGKFTREFSPRVAELVVDGSYAPLVEEIMRETGMTYQQAVAAASYLTYQTNTFLTTPTADTAG